MSGKKIKNFNQEKVYDILNEEAEFFPGTMEAALEKSLVLLYAADSALGLARLVWGGEDDRAKCEDLLHLTADCYHCYFQTVSRPGRYRYRLGEYGMSENVGGMQHFMEGFWNWEAAAQLSVLLRRPAMGGVLSRFELGFHFGRDPDSWDPAVSGQTRVWLSALRGEGLEEAVRRGLASLGNPRNEAREMIHKWAYRPRLRVWEAALAGDAEAFNRRLDKAMRKWVKLYNDDWVRGEGYKGWLALELLAVSAWAHDRGIPVEVESPYLPLWLVRGEFERGERDDLIVRIGPSLREPEEPGVVEVSEATLRRVYEKERPGVTAPENAGRPNELLGWASRAVRMAKLELALHGGRIECARFLLGAAQASAAYAATIVEPGPRKVDIHHLGEVGFDSVILGPEWNYYNWERAYLSALIMGRMKDVSSLSFLARDHLTGCVELKPWQQTICEFLRNSRLTPQFTDSYFSEAYPVVVSEDHDPETRSLLRNVYLPMMEGMYYTVAGRADVISQHLQNGLAAHARHYNGLPEERRVEGLVSLPLAMVAALAHEKGLGPQVDSPHLPMWMVRREFQLSS